MITNDTMDLVPKTSFEGRSLEFDFPSFRIGVAEYEAGPTGCTVFHFPNGAATAIDVRGGSVGTIGGYGWNHAICLAGGSLYGLEAATGVSAELFAQAEYKAGFEDIALVSGAIIYDYPPRDNTIYPDKALGRSAIQNAKVGSFPLGRRGAGCSATVGKCFMPTIQKEFGGQGGAFRQIGETKIAAFSVVNAMGAIVDRQGNVVRGHLDPETGERRSNMENIEQQIASAEAQEPRQGNTTLTVVITNQKLDTRSLEQFGKQVHTSMGRAIQPFQTLFDGDTFYAVTTNEVENPALSAIGLGIAASEVLWDAVLSVVDTSV